MWNGIDLPLGCGPGPRGPGGHRRPAWLLRGVEGGRKELEEASGRRKAGGRGERNRRWARARPWTGEAGGLHWWPRSRSRSRVASSRQTLTGAQVPCARRPGRTGAREPRVQPQKTRMVVNWRWSSKLLITSDLFIPVYSLGAPLGAAYSK